MLGTQALVRILFHVGVHGHHVVLAVQLKPMASKEEESIDVLAKERLKVFDSLQRRKRSGYRHSVVEIVSSVIAQCVTCWGMYGETMGM